MLIAPDLRARVREAHATIDRAFDEYGPTKMYVGFSGGNDSLVAAHVASQHSRFTGVFHANTGIGVEETRVFMRETARVYGWPLIEIATPISYEDLVLKHGFPGPGMHGLMYTRLKDRCVDALLRLVKEHRRERVMIVSGIRSSESQRRMGFATAMHRRRAQVWVNPLIDWTGEDVLAYREANGLPKNPVSAALGMSGECLCGAFAKPGELARVERCSPETGAYLRDLEGRVRAAGHNWGWEDGPPRKRRTARQEIAGALDFQPFCTSCSVRYEMTLFDLLTAKGDQS
jgi:3'-phosphoadenosine 5'-phosphosulfate sulfotransferase (PAPS reductase)/FAD synthetase